MFNVYLKKNEEKRLLQGENWVYANEVASIEGKDTQGSIAKVYSFDKRFIGQGFINHASKILVRLLTRDEREIDRNFFFERIVNAVNYRKKLGFDNNYRAIFSESDGLSGLIVDKYADYLVVQISSLGMDVRRQMLVEILTEIFDPRGIFERSDISVREKEGMQQVRHVLFGEIPDEIEIEENGIKLLIDVKNGQKTGYFLDQKENRENLKNYVKDASVLDCFCNIGGFALHAAKYGANEVLAVDISKDALIAVEKNAKLNGFSQVKTKAADVFEILRNEKKIGNKYDTIILDPPAFCKSKDAVKEALRGYRDINILGMKLVKSGGFLITCSCSQHISKNHFLDMLKESALSAKVSVRLVEFRAQSKDHPTDLFWEESLYLKCAVLNII